MMHHKHNVRPQDSRRTKPAVRMIERSSMKLVVAALIIFIGGMQLESSIHLMNSIQEQNDVIAAQQHQHAASLAAMHHPAALKHKKETKDPR